MESRDSNDAKLAAEPAVPAPAESGQEGPSGAPQDGDAAAGARSRPDKAPADPGTAAAGQRAGGGTLWLVALIVVLAAGAGWAWTDTRTRIAATQEELALRLRELDETARSTRALAVRADEVTRAAGERFTALESKLAEAQAQQQAVESLYQELARNRDEWQLAEIEQIVTIASHQLELSANVRAALLALQVAEARLARSDRPQFAAVRRAIGRDIDRLKALPALDVAGLNLRLERLAAGVDRLPLLHDERLDKPAVLPPAVQDAAGFFTRLGAELWSELKQLVVIRRIDAPEAPLLAPTQAYFLRENLRLRLLNARLALLSRDEAGYREDLRVAQDWVKRYFDTQAKATGEALAQLAQLAGVAIGTELPGIAETLDAVRGAQVRRERGS